MSLYSFNLLTAKTIAAVALFFSAGLFSQTVQGEQEKINHLIKMVEDSGYIFIRNGSEYNSKDAASHMRLKLSRAGNRVKTAEQFIEYLATRSSVTGSPYMLRLPDGKKIPLAEWLRKRLAGLK